MQAFFLTFYLGQPDRLPEVSAVSMAQPTVFPEPVAKRLKEVARMQPVIQQDDVEVYQCAAESPRALFDLLSEEERLKMRVTNLQIRLEYTRQNQEPGWETICQEYERALGDAQAMLDEKELFG
jgi:hypothetical protein